MRPIPAVVRGSTEFTACGNPLMARLDLPDGASLTVIRRPEANPSRLDTTTYGGPRGRPSCSPNQ